MHVMVRQRFGGENYFFHILRLTPNLDLWVMMTMMIILRNIVYKNVDCGYCVRDYVSAEAEFDVVPKIDVRLNPVTPQKSLYGEEV